MAKKKLRGLLITLEGTEGAGKSTLIRALESVLRSQGYGVRVTREPGGGPLSEKLRSFILENGMSPWTELLLYEAARAEHVAEIILPALARGEVVLCDRFTDSTLAYQGQARGLPWAKITLLNQIATQGLKPDLTVFLDIDPETGLRRAKDPNRFEAEGVAFQEKVRKGFLRARRSDPRRWLTLTSENTPIEKLVGAVLARLTKKLALVTRSPS